MEFNVQPTLKQFTCVCHLSPKYINITSTRAKQTQNKKIMNLWATEQNRKDFYIDLFSQQYHDSTWIKKTHEDMERYIKAKKSCQQWQKSDDVARLDRDLGNEFFRKKKYREAMELYNHSLCFAENGSQNIALAYSNRSACFRYESKRID